MPARGARAAGDSGERFEHVLVDDAHDLDPASARSAGRWRRRGSRPRPIRASGASARRRDEFTGACRSSRISGCRSACSTRASVVGAVARPSRRWRQGEVALLARRQRAGAGAAGRRRLERLIVREGVPPGADRGARAGDLARGAGGRGRVRRARRRPPRGRRGGVLRARRGPRRAGVAAAARRPARRRRPSCARSRARRSSCRSVDIARCMQIARRRSSTWSPRSPPRRSRRSCRPRRASGSSCSCAPPRGDGADRQHPPRPLRASPDRPARAPPPAAVRGTGRRRRAAARARALRRAGGRYARRSPQATPREFARYDRRGRRLRACGEEEEPDPRRRGPSQVCRSTAPAGLRSTTCTCSGCTPGVGAAPRPIAPIRRRARSREPVPTTTGPQAARARCRQFCMSR